MTEQEYSDLKQKLKKADEIQTRKGRLKSSLEVLDIAVEAGATFQLEVNVPNTANVNYANSFRVSIPITQPNLQSLKQILKRIEREDEDAFEDL